MPTPKRKRRLKNRLPDELAAVQTAHPAKRVQLWFQDEARFGQQGTHSRVWADTGSRPRAPRQTEYRYVYLFGAVCPETGESNAGRMPVANTAAMNAQLSHLSRQLGSEVHALVILDQAGWHQSTALAVPDNLTLLPLPPRSPELNPPERVWHELRQRHLSNRVYADQAALDDAVAAAWNAVADNPERLQRLCDLPWIKAAREAA
jgi:transposase